MSESTAQYLSDVLYNLEQSYRTTRNEAFKEGYPFIPRLLAHIEAVEGERDSFMTETDYLFQLLTPENKTAYLERLGISRERQDAAWKRVRDALEAREAAEAAKGQG